MKKTRGMFTKNLRYFCLIGLIALGLMTIVGTGGGGGGDGDADITDNSKFYGTFDYSITGTYSCLGSETYTDIYSGTLTMGSDYNRRAEEDYLYIPSNANFETYSYIDADGDSVSMTITISGDTIRIEETDECSGVPSPCFSENGLLNFNSNYSECTISIMWSNSNECQGTYAGTYTRVFTSCTDADSDGYYAESGCGTLVDCNDNDINIHPGATEICNDGKDNDCNGYIDCNDSHCLNNAACKTCTDSDKDGYYLQSWCGTLVDCNDNDINIHPGATEICGDGIDQDCDGSDKQCSGPKPGYWSGNFDGGRDISFTVSDDSNYLYDFTGKFDCSGMISGKGRYSFTLTFSRPVLAIENNEFSDAVSGSDGDFHVDGSLSGKFLSSDTASIKFSYTVKVPDSRSDSGYSYGYAWYGYH